MGDYSTPSERLRISSREPPRDKCGDSLGGAGCPTYREASSCRVGGEVRPAPDYANFIPVKPET